MAAVTLIGMNDDGCASLGSRAFNAIAKAQVLVGGERHLAFFGDFRGTRLVIKGGLTALLGEIERLSHESNVCVLASGDPLFFGIGGLLTQKLGREHVLILPQPSSVQWAFARIGMRWDDAAVLSVHGRPLAGLLTRLRAVHKAAVLTDAENTPARIARLLLASGDAGWEAWLCENLAGADERVRPFTLADLAGVDDASPLNVLVLWRTTPDWRPPPVIPALPEEAFAKRMPKLGLITKREVRVLSLAALGLRETSVVWDIGAGSGSVGIEAAMIARQGRVFLVECDPEGVAICQENCQAHGVDNVTVVAGRAPEALADLPPPDAVFVGGSKGSMQPIVEVAYERLAPGGRLVVNAVTLENVHEAQVAIQSLGATPELTVVNIARGVPLAGKYLRYEALSPIHIFACTKEAAR